MRDLSRVIKQMDIAGLIERWGVTVIAVLDLFMGAMILLASSAADERVTDSSMLGGLILGVGVLLLLLDRQAWTRPAAMMAAILQVVGFIGALAFIVLAAVFA